MLTSTDSSALLIMTFFAAHAEDMISSQDLMQAKGLSDLSPTYVAKVCQRLVRAGLLVSQRGIRGGFRIVQPPPTLATILNAVGETVAGMTVCPLHPKSKRACGCPLAQALEPFTEYLVTTTL